MMSSQLNQTGHHCLKIGDPICFQPPSIDKELLLTTAIRLPLYAKHVAVSHNINPVTAPASETFALRSSREGQGLRT